MVRLVGCSVPVLAAACVFAILIKEPLIRYGALGCALIFVGILIRNEMLPLPQAITTRDALWIRSGFIARVFQCIPWQAIARIEHHKQMESSDVECVGIYLKPGLEHLYSDVMKPFGYRDYHFSIGDRSNSKSWAEDLETFRRSQL
ncbi:MAG TPA: hypothetical protein VNV60_01190 [Holophagaceae bacterium]|nr:hypothetical protein [Holophagaceae bacterium]